MLLSLGIGLSGILTYAYFALASHELGRDAYGALAVLWSVLFISVVTLYRPVEQFVSRSVATARAEGHSDAAPIRVAATIQLVLAVAFVMLAVTLRDPIENDLLSGETHLYWILLLGAPAYAVSFFARGYLAGTGRFGLYGSMLLLESTSRFAMAAAVVVGVLSGGTAISLGILLAPLMSLTVVPLVAFGGKGQGPQTTSLDPIGEEPESPVAVGTSLGRGGAFVGSAFLVMLSEQALLNAGVLVVAAGVDVAAAGLLFNVMLVARAPQVLFGSVTTSLLPSLSRHWVARSQDRGAAFRGEVTGTIKAVALFDAALIVVVAVVGPDLMRLTFGADHTYDRAGLVIVAVGLGFHLGALTLTQAQLARDRAPGAAVCWVVCAIGFVVFTAMTFFPAVRQAEVGYATAAAALSLLLYWQYREAGSKSVG
ncbi:MAG: hypothetical protein R2718_12430 [Solirubrobacterales bacterium]